MIQNLNLQEISNYYSRVFIFTSTQSLTPYLMALQNTIEVFLTKWKNETNPLVNGNWGLVDNHFLMVFADESKHMLSGCSKDYLFRMVFGFGKEYGLEIPSSCLFFQDALQETISLSRTEFIQAKENGKITSQTLVYDTTLTEAKKLPQFLKSCENSWHRLV